MSSLREEEEPSFELLRLRCPKASQAELALPVWTEEDRVRS